MIATFYWFYYMDIEFFLDLFVINIKILNIMLLKLNFKIFIKISKILFKILKCKYYLMISYRYFDIKESVFSLDF